MDCEVFRELEPHPALSPFVDRFWARSAPAGIRSTPSRILPDGCIDLVVDLDRGRHEIVGTMTRAASFNPAEPTRLVAVRFRPGGATPFLRVSAHEFTDRVVDVRDLDSSWIALQPLEGATELFEAVGALQRALLARLSAIHAPDPLVQHAVSALFTPAAPAIAALARSLGCSRQHLARAFRAHVGIAPVQLARVARLQRAVVALQRSDGRSLADTAQRLGYFDQAHLSLDFRELAGVTPRQAAVPGSIFPIRSLLGLHDPAHD